MAQLRHGEHPHRRARRRTARRAKRRWPRRCSRRPARSRQAGSVERGTTVSDFDPLEKSYQHSLRASLLHLDTQRHAHPPDRHARLPRFHRPGDRRARRGRDGGGRRQRERRHRDDHVADDGVGGEAPPVPARSSSTRSTPRTSICPALLAQIQQAFGKECLPINLPADGGKRVVDCFFNPAGETRFLVGGRGAPGARRPGGRGRRGADGEVPRARRGRAGRSCTRRSRRRCAKGHLMPVCFVSARTGAGVDGTARHPRQARAESDRGQPAAVHQGRRRQRDRVPLACPIRRSTCSRTCSRSSIDPFVGKLGIFRVHQGTVTKDTQLYVGDGRKPLQGRPPVHAAGRQDTSRSTSAVPGDIAAVAKVDEIHVRLRAARFARRGPHPHAAARVPGRRCTAWRSRRSAAATSSASPRCCTR